VRFPCFDGIRAVAAMSVFVFHAAFFTGATRRGGGSLLWGLNLGVTIFFVTSGFLLYRPFVLAHLEGRRTATAAYFRRRLARIFPAYWVALIGLALLSHAHMVGFGEYLSHFTLTSYATRGQDWSGIPQAWTLTIELAFYLFLPLYAVCIAALARRRRVEGVETTGLACLLLVGVVSKIAVAYGDVPQGILVLPARLHYFALGMGLAVLSVVPARNRVVDGMHRAATNASAWWLGALAVFVLAPTLTGNQHGPPLSGGRSLLLDLCEAAVAFMIVVPAALGRQDVGTVRALLRSRPVRYVGTVSYGVYLWHFAIIQIVIVDWFGWSLYEGNVLAVLAVAVPVVVAIASASWYAVERPILRRVHRATPRPLPADRVAV
jgi:peptidoglycan/LPS O-acetylase OafA/YrhL